MADTSTTVSKQGFDTEVWAPWTRLPPLKSLFQRVSDRRALESELEKLPQKIRQDIGMSRDI